MNVSIIGTGYVGLSTAAGLASKGHRVICVDKDPSKINAVKAGKSHFYEEGIEEALAMALSKGLLEATMDTAYAVKNSDITFICVGTPSDDSGKINLDYIKDASAEVGIAMKGNQGHVVVVKSTVVPGTTETVILPILQKYSKNFGLCMNPEFLREGKALEDFLHPDRIVVGELDRKSGDALSKLYEGFGAPVIRTKLSAAEMIKYASNVFLASRISMINELGNICKKLGIDVYDVANAIGRDKRIGPHFLEAGAGFGGSCFPKDVSALQHRAEEIGCETGMMEQILKTNASQRRVLVELLKKKTSIKGKKIAVLGLAFKEDTDDIRESPAIDIIEMLKKEGASVYAYDPKAADNMKRIYPEVTYCSVADALKDAEACLILAKWKEFSSLTDRDFAAMKGRIIIEAKKVLDASKVKDFEGICW
ncbi:MAG: UDP-glucose/GDP-mannose dehydrogenase family protein [Candidatus Aenigmarchaeota archaeon]|nr:UDP-glucose/GDP-mannose dehydrogenase family protein [Candidatus Aenigmarchaeota archaeon]